MASAWQRELLTRGGTHVFQWLAATWRLRSAHDMRRPAIEIPPGPCVYACWHSQMLPLLAWHRHVPAAVLASEHGDAEMIVRAAEPWGIVAIRGSTTRGGARALLAMTKALEAGWRVAVTPDGPRGPAETFSPGALIAAQRAQVPIFFMAAVPRREWRLSSWDRFSIPKPFTEIAIGQDGPYQVQSTTMRGVVEEVAVAQQRLAALNDVVRRAARGDR